MQAQMPLTGKRRSLLIGINYFGSSAELNGCVNDVRRMQPILHKLGFPPDPQSQMVLVDDGSSQWGPTKENMRRAIQWLVQGAAAGDSLFLHYSGHGGRESKSDGYHETLCPVDYEKAGCIEDTELFQILVRPLPSGSRLTCMIDACHSAGALDLPYLFTGTEENLKKALAGEAIEMAMSKNWIHSLQKWDAGDPSALLMDVGGLGLGLWNLWKKKEDSEGADKTGFRTEEGQNVALAVGEVIAISGCRSDQTSADVGDVGRQFNLNPQFRSGAGGALTSAFLEAMETWASNQPSWLQLLEGIRQKLTESGFSQVPQLASSLLIDLNCRFSVDQICLPAQAGGNQGGGSAGGGGGNNGGARSRSAGGDDSSNNYLAAIAAAPLGMAMLGGMAGGCRGGSGSGTRSITSGGDDDYDDDGDYDNYDGLIGGLVDFILP